MEKKNVHDILKEAFGDSLQQQFSFSQSSASSGDTGVSQVLFFEPFLAQSMDIGCGLSVSMRGWASAFLLFEVEEIFKALLSDVCHDRNEMEKQKLIESEDVKNVIQNAADWMMEKTQDPWSYTPPTNSISDINISPKKDQIPNQTENDYFKAYNKFVKISKSENDPKLPNIGNCAQIVKSLTVFTIPQNTDIFVDAVQFSRGRWSKASKCNHKDLHKIAEVLFRKYLKYDYYIRFRKFESFEEFCPVKRLAIIRATAFLRFKNCFPDIFAFDSADKSHNLFLNKQQYQEISSYITNEYGIKNPQDVGIN